MLNVSQEAKQAYMSGNARTALFLTVTAEDGTGSPVIYSPTNILSGSVSIVESLCSSQAFDISRVEKNQLTFTLFNITENISDLQGKIVTAKQTITFPDDSTEDIPLGRYKIVEAVNDGDYLIKCTAYDDMLKLDAIADEWWNTDVTFPITIRDLLISMLTEVGIGTTGIPATFNNSTFEIAERTVYFDNASYSEVLGYIQEVVGAFFKIDRNGVMQMYSVEMSQTPDIEYAYQQIVSDLSVADFTVQPITALQVKGTEDDIGITVGVDGNVYVILGNPLLYNLTAETGNTVCTNILTAISGVTYTPFTAKVMCQPYSEVGDTIALTTYKGLEAGSVVFNRTMSGARLSFDSIVSKGEQERSEVTRNVERQVTVLNQRTHEIVNDVETLSSTITQVETDLSGQIQTNTTAIQQNSREITIQAQRIGYCNYIQNSNFTSINGFDHGWTLQNASSGLLSGEVIYDSDFVNSNGKALKLTKISSGSSTSVLTRYYQTYNFDGENFNGKTIYFLFELKVLSQLLMNNLRAYVAYQVSGSTVWHDAILAALNPPAGVGKRTQYRFSKTFTEDTYITLLNVYVPYPTASNGDYYGEWEVNNMCLLVSDSGDPVPAFGTWTDISKNDLISQINLSPAGMRINADKITVDTSSLDLTFGSDASHVTIKATNADDGVLFDGTGKVHFETTGEFYVKNLDTTSTSRDANRILLTNSASSNTASMANISKTGSSATTANQVYMASNSTMNYTSLYNYNDAGNARNLLQLSYTPAQAKSITFYYNYHNNNNLANSLYMESTNNSGRIILANNNSDGSVRTGLYMNANGSFRIQTNTGGTSRIEIPGQGDTGTGNINLIAAGNLYFNPAGDITVGSYTGAGSGGSVTGTANPTLKNYDGRDVVLHFYKGIYTGFTFN